MSKSPQGCFRRGSQKQPSSPKRHRQQACTASCSPAMPMVHGASPQARDHVQQITNIGSGPNRAEQRPVGRFHHPNDGPCRDAEHSRSTSTAVTTDWALARPRDGCFPAPDTALGSQLGLCCARLLCVAHPKLGMPHSVGWSCTLAWRLERASPARRRTTTLLMRFILDASA